MPRAKVPLTTFMIVALCVTLHIYQFFLDPPLQNFTLNPRLIIYAHEYYRLITSTMFHSGIMHLGMNMLSTLSIAGALETRFGSVPLGLSILISILSTSLLHVFVTYAYYKLSDDASLIYGSSVGFSGVIFHLAVLEASTSPPNSTRSLFGFAQIPTAYYPVALLIALQVTSEAKRSEQQAKLAASEAS